MKTIVVYNSKTGFTKRYGEWIAKKLECEAVPMKGAEAKLKDYDIVIFGGWIMAGKIVGWDKVKTNPTYTNKKLVVYATGGTPMDGQRLIDEMRTNNFTPEEREKIPYYFFESGINFENMGFGPKTLLKTLRKILVNKKEKTKQDLGMIELFAASSDHTNEEYVNPLVNYVKGL